MFERFTERSRQVMIYAREEAETSGCSVQPNHFMKALIRSLARIDTESEVLDGNHPMFSTSSKELIERAIKKARSNGDNYIGVEHILYALLHK